jgi:hypothetical protein
MKNKYTPALLTLALVMLLTVPVFALAQGDEPAAIASERGPLTYAILTVLMFAVIVGSVYNLWRTTRAFGGIIGEGLRRIGVGSLILVVVALDRLALNFKVGIISGLVSKGYQSLVHDLLLIAAMFFILVGYRRLLSIANPNQNPAPKM